MCFDTILLKGIVWKFKPTVRPRVMKARLRISLSPKIPQKPSLLSEANVTESLGLAMMGKWGGIWLGGHGWWIKPYRVPSEPERKKKRNQRQSYFSRKAKTKNKANKNQNPRIIRLSEARDVYFTGFDLLLEMVGASGHLLINNWGLLEPTWWVMHFSSWILKTAFYRHYLGLSLWAHHSLRYALWN